MKTAIELIHQERQEQIRKHGYDLDHDKTVNKNGELVQAALFCIEQSLIEQSLKSTGTAVSETKSWPLHWGKKYENKIRAKSSIGQLMCAGAFFIAENDRRGSEAYADDIRRVEAIITELLRLPFEVEKYEQSQTQKAAAIKKPPIGLMPKWLWIEQRMNEIARAIDRYRAAGMQIPKKWEKELARHQKTILQRQNRKSWNNILKP
jgi:hypothetical protein